MIPDLEWRVPWLTQDIPGIGGQIRVHNEDFIVDEVPAYEPCGEGEHVYFRVEKRGVSTGLLIKEIAANLGIQTKSISCAGLKDKHAIARQTLSVFGVPEQAVQDLSLDDATVLWVNRHKNKLRTGHLRGNRFEIRIRNVDQAATEHLPGIAAQLLSKGVPNAYGPQRFGYRKTNQIAGYHLLRNDRQALIDMGVRHPSYRIRQLFVSALQSALFNQVVTLRMQMQKLDTVIDGDLAKKTDTGGMFTVEDVTIDQARAKRWEISATGPMYGYKMMPAKRDAAAIEAQVLADSGIQLEEFRAVKAKGLRRPLRYYPEGLTIDLETEDTVLVSFFAPKGSYATMLLRELMKTDVELPE